MSRLLLVILALVALSTPDVVAYSRPRFQISGVTKQSRWRTTNPVSVLLNVDAPNSIVPGSQPLPAVRNMFEIRSAYSAIRFSITQGSFPENLGFDGVSVVTFKDTLENRSVTAGFGAVTYFWFSISGGAPVVIESDIAFNPTIGHSTTGAGGFDIENLGGHEVTHFLSLEHSAVVGSTGFPNFDATDLSRRTLALDDLAGTEFLYPFADTPARTGSLSGTVMKGGTTAVFGAHVVAVRASDGSVVSDVSVTGGQWRIDALPPGDYTVYVEPFDGPCYPYMVDDGLYGSTPFDTSFRTEFVGGNDAPTVYTVTPGAEVAGITSAPAAAVPSLNPNAVGLSPNGVTFAVTGAQVTVTQGTNAWLVVWGPGIHLVPDTGLAVTGPGVSVSSTGVVRGMNGGIPYMIAALTVAPDAPDGVRSVLVDDGPNLGTVTGGFEVRRASPLPGLLRNDAIFQLEPTTPALATIFPLRPTGADGVSGIGEGVRRADDGTSDDDDFYVPEVPSGYIDADPGVAGDATRPLVFYQLTDPTLVLRLEKTLSGRIQVIY